MGEKYDLPGRRARLAELDPVLLQEVSDVGATTFAELWTRAPDLVGPIDELTLREWWAHSRRRGWIDLAPMPHLFHLTAPGRAHLRAVRPGARSSATIPRTLVRVVVPSGVAGAVLAAAKPATDYPVLAGWALAILAFLVAWWAVAEIIDWSFDRWVAGWWGRQSAKFAVGWLEGREVGLGLPFGTQKAPDGYRNTLRIPVEEFIAEMPTSCDIP